MAAQPLGNITP
ncbi:hypothetical protein XBKQ1_2360003 [Xenorhabdus bovienii str. kraussei Quebec]|uniref:Uncharacterized protein n=2 Tax=Xenorhabdus bovienii TaxID=40576 RepID=A0A077P5V4_XENBV|nr:hypothetical protein XBKQ1_2360003 [Xenorhabdus bovienii str. kraussei Quebec]